MRGGAVQEVNDVDGESKHQQCAIDHHHAQEELHRQIAIERPRPAHAMASLRRRRRSRIARGLSPISTNQASTMPRSGMT